MIPVDMSRNPQITWLLKNSFCQSEALKSGRRKWLLKKYRYQGKDSRIMKNQVNKTPPKKTNKAPNNALYRSEYLWTAWQFRIVLLEKFSELQEHMTEN